MYILLVNLTNLYSVMFTSLILRFRDSAENSTENKRRTTRIDDVNLAKREYNRFVKHDRTYPLLRKNIAAHARENV